MQSHTGGLKEKVQEIRIILLRNKRGLVKCMYAQKRHST